MASSHFDVPSNLTLSELNQRFHNRLWKSITSLAEHKTLIRDKAIRILHHNVKSLLKKFHFYESLHIMNSCDIFSVSESWLKPSLPDSMIDLPGFDVIRCDRNSKIKVKGGGTALYIKSNIDYKILHHLTTSLSNVCDSSVWVELAGEKSKPLIIGSIYVTPDSDKTKFLEGLSSILSLPSLLNKHIVIVGDININ